MKFVGLFKLMPVAVVAVSLLTACGNAKYAKQVHGGSATANQYVTTKPKIDIVVFQDDSDSIIYNGPLGVLKPQMANFLGNLSSQWDYRFTVMPLLTSKSLSQKYVVASDCGGISGVMGCLSPSQHNTFTYSSGDYGWINSANFSGGDDRGFRHIRTNLQNMGGFIRSDAALAVIVISNGDDLEGVGITTRSDGYQERNYNTTDAYNSYETFRSYFANLKSGSSVLKRFYPVVVNSSGSCLNGYYGRRYVQMAGEFTGSRSYNICSGELNSSMNDIKQQLVAITEAIRFDHVVISADRAPVVSSIKVWKNGVEIPQGGPNGWTYVGNQNRATSYYPTSGNVRSGYMIQLSGSARYQGSDQITFDFDPL